MDVDRSKDDLEVTHDCDAEALGTCSHAEGCGTRAIGDCSHAEGKQTVARGKASHAEGCCTKAIQKCSHSEGEFTVARGEASHAEGYRTLAREVASHSEGSYTRSNARSAHAEGHDTTASGFASHAEGFSTEASGEAAHAEGRDTISSGANSHAEGSNTTASGDSSHAEGRFNEASAGAAHVEGTACTASGDSSHAEGTSCAAIGDSAHAEGFNNRAEGSAAHAEGASTQATGFASHAEGVGTIASGEGAHAEGIETNALGFYSHTEGRSTTSLDFEGAHIMGRFGAAEQAYSWFLANGVDTMNTGLAAKILSDGSAFADIGWSGGGADYAEMFETLDGQAMEPGYLVTLDGEKIRKATADDDYVLGVVSAVPAVLADSGELRWKGKFVTDEWGRVQYHDVVVPPVRDTNGEVRVPERTERQPMINPDWDPAKSYLPRLKRPEWVPVGLVGKLLVRDDGTCQVNGYCRPGQGGVATAAQSGYRVMKRTGPNQVLILFR